MKDSFSIELENTVTEIYHKVGGKLRIINNRFFFKHSLRTSKLYGGLRDATTIKYHSVRLCNKSTIREKD